MARVRPGLAFSLVCDLGFAVGLVTHQVPRWGDLIWLAEPMFDEQPGVAAVEAIERWRWPVFFPTSAAIRQKVIDPVGLVEIPRRLRPFPRMRGGNRQMGWREVKFGDDGQHIVGATRDASLPISQVVNDTALKEMLVTGWKPEQVW